MRLRDLIFGLTTIIFIFLGMVIWVASNNPSKAQTLPPAPERFWTENICPQDVTAPPVTCTFLRTEGSTVRVPLVDPTGYTYGMILIDAGHVTFVQATATPTPIVPAYSNIPPLIDLNTATEAELSGLPRDEYGQRLGLYEIQTIVRFRPYATLDALPLGPDVIAAIRGCSCTRQP